jgi:chemotaxis regulatin CheY-phosphate phosphatase CheZ
MLPLRCLVLRELRRETLHAAEQTFAQIDRRPPHAEKLGASAKAAVLAGSGT